MSDNKLTILTHGGAGSKNEYADGTKDAAQACIAAYRSGDNLVRAVCRAVAASAAPRFPTLLSYPPVGTVTTGTCLAASVACNTARPFCNR